MSERILVVAAHADDEVLGCGGTMARHAEQGDQVRVVFLADGVTARAGADAAELAQRKQAAEQAAAILGVAQLDWLGLPDNRLDQYGLLNIVQPLESIVSEFAPVRVYTHHGGDLNVDHRLAEQAVLTACRPQPGASVREILAFEVLSSTGWGAADHRPFVPTTFVDIFPFLEQKLAALDAYADEMRLAPHARSREGVLHLAGYRGTAVGMVAAEAFMQLRRLL